MSIIDMATFCHPSVGRCYEKATFGGSESGLPDILGTTNQNDHRLCQRAMKHTYQMVAKFSKWPQTIPTISIPRP
jgi:hypothetical protein